MTLSVDRSLCEISRDINSCSDKTSESLRLLLSPDLPAGGYVDKLDLYAQRVASLRHSAHDDRRDFAIAPDFLRINFLPLVPKNGRARHYLQRGQAREAIDDVFGDTV